MTIIILGVGLNDGTKLRKVERNAKNNFEHFRDQSNLGESQSYKKLCNRPICGAKYLKKDVSDPEKRSVVLMVVKKSVKVLAVSKTCSTFAPPFNERGA